MNTLAYSFDLGPTDYIAMNMHPWKKLGSWYRHTAKSAVGAINRAARLVTNLQMRGARL